MEIEITLNKDLLDDKDFDFFHYGCGYELAKCKYGTWRIDSLGELKCNYYDDNGNWVDNAINTIQNNYVRNNDEYIKAIEHDNLRLDMNNWFSIEFFDNNGNFIENTYYCDSVFGSISEAYNDFMYTLEHDKDELEEELKELL